MRILEGKIAVITGANSGIGSKTAKLFASEGAKIVGIARRAEALEEVRAEIVAADGVFISYPGDITVDDDINGAIDTAVKEFGKIDILVNCAGVLDAVYSAGEMSNELWDEVVAVNLTAPMKSIRRALYYMCKQETGGNIINLSSTAGLNGCVGGAAYTATKHGLVGLTKNVATMYVDEHIRCNAICPHAVDTPMLDAEQIESFCADGIKRQARGTGGRTIRRGQPEEISNIALFLASDASSFLNGVSIAADAGFSAF